jgi:outer membrane protein assembly factor BamB
MIYLSIILKTFRKGEAFQLVHWSISAFLLCALQPIWTARSEGGSAENWPAFRGPGAYGHAMKAQPPLDWSVETGKNIVWKTPIPKSGMSSPVVWGDKIILTGGDAEGRQVYGFETATGKLIWTHDVVDIAGTPSKEQLPDLMETSGFAAPTATIDGSYVAAIFATGDLVCLDLEGRRIWAKNLGLPKNHYGHSSSLITNKNLLYVQYDQAEGSKLYAFDIASGKLAWQVDRGSISWSSPILIENQNRQELILTNCKTIDSYDPRTGNQLWTVPGMDGEVAPSATYADGVIFVANEYAAAAGIDIRKHTQTPEILWVWNEVLPDASSPLANDKYVIIPSGYGIITCLDAKAGEVYWEHEFEEGFYSSPILVGSSVYVIDLKGTMQIFKMSKSFQLLGSPSINEPCNSTPAFVGERIYIRGTDHLICVQTESN